MINDAHGFVADSIKMSVSSFSGAKQTGQPIRVIIVMGATDVFNYFRPELCGCLLLTPTNHFAPKLSIFRAIWFTDM